MARARAKRTKVLVMHSTDLTGQPRLPRLVLAFEKWARFAHKSIVTTMQPSDFKTRFSHWPIGNAMIANWQQERTGVAYVIKNRGFMLTHQTDYDPEGYAAYRVFIDLIYVENGSRRSGVAKHLLAQIKLPAAAITCSEESVALFLSQGYTKSKRFCDKYSCVLKGALD